MQLLFHEDAQGIIRRIIAKGSAIEIAERPIEPERLGLPRSRLEPRDHPPMRPRLILEHRHDLLPSPSPARADCT